MCLPNYKRAGSGPVLVFVHGYLGGSAQWLNEINALQWSFDVVAVDLPGYGNAHDKEAPQTIKGFAESVIALLDSLEIDEFSLLGHSMGGMIVQEMAHLVQSRVKKLILYGTGPIGPMPNRFETHARSRQRLKEEGFKPTVERTVAKWFLNGDKSEGYKNCISLAFMADMDSGLAGLSAMESWDGREYLENLNLPVQIIWGEFDRSYGFSEQSQLWEKLPNVSLAVIPRACHVVHMEQPSMFMSVLKDFLNEES